MSCRPSVDSLIAIGDGEALFVSNNLLNLCISTNAQQTRVQPSVSSSPYLEFSSLNVSLSFFSASTSVFNLATVIDRSHIGDLTSPFVITGFGDVPPDVARSVALKPARAFCI